MSPGQSTFQRKLAFGAIAEGAIANWLRSRGNSILPVYEIEMDKGKGPRLFAPDSQIIAPDMLSFKDGNICWIEAKHKSVFSWHRKTMRWVTGIDLHHYENYLSIADRYPYEVWMMFLHRSSRPDVRDLQYGCPSECPDGLFAGKLSVLRHNENHRHANHGRTGMVYWSRESLKRLATLREVECAILPAA